MIVRIRVYVTVCFLDIITVFFYFFDIVAVFIFLFYIDHWSINMIATFASGTLLPTRLSKGFV